MLTCYGHRVRLPQNDLAYLAFRLALRDTLSDIDTYLDLEEEPDPPVGYLTEVPFLEQVPLQVQVDLLADAWARHRKPELIEASLLDAAVVFAACVTAGRVIDDMPDVAVTMLRDGPQQVSARIIHRASFRLEEMFEVFWDDQDFLMINEWQDLHPDHAQYLKEVMRLPDEAIEPMYEALRRWRVSPDLAANLEGLLTEAEMHRTSNRHGLGHPPNAPPLSTVILCRFSHVEADSLEKDQITPDGLLAHAGKGAWSNNSTGL